MYFNVTGGGVDYFSGPYSVIFPIEVTVASFNITIKDDNLLENDETFNVSITSISNGHMVGTPAVATVIIIDTTSKRFIVHIQYMQNLCRSKLNKVCTYVCDQI